MKNLLRKLAPSLIAISVFITGMIFLFVHEKTTMNNKMMVICGLYSLVCLLFLFFQLYAFISVHLGYDEDLEKIKYQVFEAEGMEYVEEEIC